jgi:hypothetical protein
MHPDLRPRDDRPPPVASRAVLFLESKWHKEKAVGHQDPEEKPDQLRSDNLHFSWVVLLLLFYAIPAAVICLPLIWWHRSIGWKWWEFMLLIVPFALWLCLVVMNFRVKTLSNAVIEPALCGCAAGAPLVLKVMATHRRQRTIATAFIGLIVSCLLVVVIYLSMPAIPE